ncbi:MAG: hypothetical protein HYV18_05265 [Gammaproteobacteria bacterium]|nr:hypothetical protein [Gammaproteobacteria bacterium]
MKKRFKYAALAALMGAGMSGAALADSAETRGGIKVKSDDGRFEGTLGGRLHYDANMVDEDKVTENVANGFFMRRAYITLGGQLYGIKYRLETDVAGSSVASKDMWFGLDALGGFVKAGHFQPAYGMEALTGSNEVLFMERPFISSNGVFSSREYQNGVGYSTDFAGAGTVFVNYYSGGPAADKSASSAAEGDGIAARVTFAPVIGDGEVAHVGASLDRVNYDAKTGAGPYIKPGYAAKNGPTALLVDKATYDTQTTGVLELAGAVGPFFAQGEYARAEFDGASDQTLISYYVQTSFFVTGETKPYDAKKGVFKSPKPAGEMGAVELKARYDYAKNEDGATKPEVATTSVGVNYYLNPNVRVMAEFARGESKTTTTEDRPTAVALRAQLSF